MIFHQYTCSVCQYSRQKLTRHPQTGAPRYEDRDSDYLEGFRGHTFNFCTMQELEEELECCFSPAHVTFEMYEEFLCVSVTAAANNKQAITEELMQAFHAGKCCLWQYTLFLSQQDGTLSGFIGNESLQDIPYAPPDLERIAAPAHRRMEAAWQQICKERGCSTPSELNEIYIDLIMRAMDWTHRTVPRLHEIVKALHPYALVEYDNVAQAYADLFECSLQRAEELIAYHRSYPQYHNSPEERILWREDICFAEFTPKGKTYLIMNY